MSTIQTAPRRAWIKPIVIMLIIILFIMGIVFAWQTVIGKMTGKFMAAAATAPQAVSTVTAATSDWQYTYQSTGSLRAVRGADLSPQAPGVVDVLSFDSGNDVAAGKVLLRLKPNDDYARLEQLKATADLAQITLKRDREQLSAQAIAQATIDTDVANLKSAKAQVDAQQALIQEKIVIAPFAGRLGIRQVDIGQYLSAGTVVVTLQALDPILLDFYLPQQVLAKLKVGQKVTATVDTFPGESFAGEVESLNSKVDPNSRNVQVRAALHNPQKKLMPGMFANVSVNYGKTESHITLPQAVVTYNPYGDTVFLVEDQG